MDKLLPSLLIGTVAITSLIYLTRPKPKVDKTSKRIKTLQNLSEEQKKKYIVKMIPVIKDLLKDRSFEKANKCSADLLVVLNSLYGERYYLNAMVYYYLFLGFAGLDKIGQGLEYLLMAVELSQDESHQECLFYCRRVMSVFMDMDDWKSAVFYGIKATELIVVEGMDELAEVWSNLGYAYIKLNIFDKAEIATKRARKLMVDLKGFDSIDTVKESIRLSQIYFSLDCKSEAISVLDENYERLLESQSEDPDSLLPVLLALVIQKRIDMTFDCDRFDLNEEYIINAIDTMDERYSTGYHEQLASCYWAAGNDSLAKSTFEKLSTMNLERPSSRSKYLQTDDISINETQNNLKEISIDLTVRNFIAQKKDEEYSYLIPGGSSLIFYLCNSSEEEIYRYQITSNTCSEISVTLPPILIPENSYLKIEIHSDNRVLGKHYQCLSIKLE